MGGMGGASSNFRFLSSPMTAEPSRCTAQVLGDEVALQDAALEIERAANPESNLQGKEALQRQRELSNNHLEH
jgi:hypothetical protein